MRSLFMLGSSTHAENGPKKVKTLIRGSGKLALIAAVAVSLTGPASAWDMTHLQNLLASTPEGGWVQANTTSFSSAWASPAQGGLSPGSYSNPGAIVRAWSSFAWDSNRGNLILFGGGHANYVGNEVYLWSATTGGWSRGSLPSMVQSVANVPGAFSGEFVVVDGAAPLSQHTYENNVFLPTIDRMAMLGGASFNSGGAGRKLVDGTLVPTGPWMWDPSKANPDQVGGTTGSGYLASSVGGQMWTDRRDVTTGNLGGNSIDSSTAYRLENGRDVVYTARMSGGSGWPTLYRYTPGAPELGEVDLWERVAVADNAASFQSSAAIDLENSLYVRTAFQPSTGRYGLGVWDLAKANSFTANSLRDLYIGLEYADGSIFRTNTNFAVAYDSNNSRFVMWDGANNGEVFYVDAEYLSDGSLDSVWTVTRALSTTAAQPSGKFVSPSGALGVLGKWQYIHEVGAFMALDMIRESQPDAGVWLYKPYSVTAIPEPSTVMMALFGIIFLLGRLRRSRQDYL